MMSIQPALRANLAPLSDCTTCCLLRFQPLLPLCASSRRFQFRKCRLGIRQKREFRCRVIEAETEPESNEDESEVICSFVNYLLQEGIYSDFIQNNLAPSNFVRVPTDLVEYLKDCKFLPLLHNEIAAKRNSTYKERFSSLEKLVLVMFENDTVLVPRETSWFGYFKDGSMSTVLPYNETQLYTEDWFGLKTLDEAGKIEFISVVGGHLAITECGEPYHSIP